MVEKNYKFHDAYLPEQQQQTTTTTAAVTTTTTSHIKTISDNRNGNVIKNNHIKSGNIID